MFKTWIFIIILNLLGSPTRAQERNVSMETREAVEGALDLMDQGDYHGANRLFREILSSKQVLPTNLSYWFSETLFMIDQYQNSRNFADKYLEIAGRRGDYYAEAQDLIKLLDTKMTEIALCQFCDISGYRYLTCSNCDGIGEIFGDCHFCKGRGEHSCRRCFGEGVLITRRDFGLAQYQTCPLCEGSGIEVCILCHGARALKGDCPVCYGTGLESSKIICDHERHSELNSTFIK